MRSNSLDDVNCRDTAVQCEDVVAVGVHAIVVVVVVVVVECSHSDMGYAGCIPAAVDATKAGRDLEHVGDIVQAKAVRVEAGYRKAAVAVAVATEAVKCA